MYRLHGRGGYPAAVSQRLQDETPRSGGHPGFVREQNVKDAINEAIRDWVTHVQDTYYLLGSVVGPHPYPMMVRDFQSVIGKEVRKQVLEKEGRLPDVLVACVGGGSNAMGLFHPFYKESVRFIGVEAGGQGVTPGRHAASLNAGSIGSLHGTMSYLLQSDSGNILETYSIAPGLDYPGVGPEHAFFKESKRAEYVTVTDEEALEAFRLLSETEGIIPALECSHAIAYVLKLAPSLEERPDRHHQPFRPRGQGCSFRGRTDRS